MDRFLRLDSPFIRFLSRIVDIAILNFLFIIYSIPILTIGASITALYTVTIKMVRNEDPYILGTFVSSFKKNFKQGTMVWAIMLFLGLLFALDLRFLAYLSGIAKFFFAGLTATFGFVYLCILLFIFPYLARYEDTIKKSMINSLLIGISNFVHFLMLLLLTIVPAVFTFSSPVGFLTGLYMGTFGGFALLALIHSFIINKVFSKYETVN